jgi:hypothetical protein
VLRQNLTLHYPLTALIGGRNTDQCYHLEGLGKTLLLALQNILTDLPDRIFYLLSWQKIPYGVIVLELELALELS